jgi:RNA polymerase sigma-70 factor (ECF subfamily)
VPGDAKDQMAALAQLPRDEWLTALHGPPAVREPALAELHALLLLGKLDTFRGASRFTTWAYKFALLEAGVKARRRAWRDREVPLEDTVTDRGPSAHQVLEDAETLRAVREAMDTVLTPHQRQVFVALALNGVPIDVLAERLDTTRGALYKTLHDARRKLRAVIGGER